MKPTLTCWGGLSNYKVSPQCINKKSSSEWCCYVQKGQKDLLCANVKDLIQSWRIWIRVASLSLVSFRHLSVLVWGWLMSYINIYLLYADDIISNRFLSSLEWSGVFVFGSETWHFWTRRWRNLAESPSNTHNKRSLIWKSHVCHRCLAVESY